LQIYISSTLTDLAEYRAAVTGALARIGDPNVQVQIAGPPDMALESPPALDALLQLIADSDVFILMLGWRYGYIPAGHAKSLVELEYEAAKDHGCVTLCFVVDDRASVVGSLVETGENAAALRRFKARVQADDAVHRFSTPQELAEEVVFAVRILMNRPIARGRRRIIRRPAPQKEIEKLRRERDRQIATIAELRDRLADLVPAAPIWRSRRFEIDTTLCFCLLPFQDNFTRVYEEAVVPAVEASGLRGLHAGQIFDNREIMEDIWESLCAARLVVADVTDRNPNVFYELGICHTLGKEVIVITQRPNDVPFDIRHRRFIEYTPNKLASLRGRLQQTIQHILLRREGESGA
jgi:hypothetical protein